MGGFTAASSALRPRPTNRRRGSLGGEGQLRLSPNSGFGRASDLLDAEPQQSAAAQSEEAAVRSLPAVVVGMANYAGWRQSREAGIRSVVFARQPDNAHDASAIQALLGGREMGYLPRQLASVLSAFIDQGEMRLLPVTLSAEEVEALPSDGECAPAAFAVQLRIRLELRAQGGQALLDSLLPDCEPQPDEVPPTPTALPPPPRSTHCERTPGLGVLSLFSGISADMMALAKARIPCRLYVRSCPPRAPRRRPLSESRIVVGQASSEVEAAALSVASRAFRTQWPSTTHLELGDVRCLSEEYLAALARDCELDLLIGGSPCQDLSRMAVRLLGAFPVGLRQRCRLRESPCGVGTRAARAERSIVLPLLGVRARATHCEEGEAGGGLRARECVRDAGSGPRHHHQGPGRHASAAGEHEHLHTTLLSLGCGAQTVGSGALQRACDVSACRRDRYFWSNLPPRGLRPLPAAELPTFAEVSLTGAWSRLRPVMVASL